MMGAKLSGMVLVILWVLLVLCPMMPAYAEPESSTPDPAIAKTTNDMHPGVPIVENELKGKGELHVLISTRDPDYLVTITLDTKYLRVMKKGGRLLLWDSNNATDSDGNEKWDAFSGIRYLLDSAKFSQTRAPFTTHEAAIIFRSFPIFTDSSTHSSVSFLNVR